MESILRQTYPNIELIIVDDASVDRSAEIIETFVETLPVETLHATSLPVQTIFNASNQGNCRSFNTALKLTRGKYVIDLAADDLMYPQRIEKQVAQLEGLPSNVAVGFSDSWYIDHKNRIIGKSISSSINAVPSGDIFKSLLTHSFICPTTLIFRRGILEELGAYDETLSFEDLDIWFRLARKYQFVHLPEKLMFKRILPTSVSAQRFQKNNTWLPSALKIMQKVHGVLQNSEREAFAVRINHYIAESFWSAYFDLAYDFRDLIPKHHLNFKSRIYLQLCQWRIHSFSLYFYLLNFIVTFKKYYFYLTHGCRTLDNLS